MKARLLFLLLLPVCMWAARSQAQTKITPIDFNDDLVKITETLYQMGTEWGAQFAAISSDDRDFSKLAAPRRKLTDYISSQLTAVKQLKNVGVGADKLKQAMLDFLVFEEQMIFEGFIPMEKLNKESTTEAVQTASQRLTDLASKEGEMLDKVNQTQEQYATDNGFTLEAKK